MTCSLRACKSRCFALSSRGWFFAEMSRPSFCLLCHCAAFAKASQYYFALCADKRQTAGEQQTLLEPAANCEPAWRGVLVVGKSSLDWTDGSATGSCGAQGTTVTHVSPACLAAVRLAFEIVSPLFGAAAAFASFLAAGPWPSSLALSFFGAIAKTLG